MTFFCPYRKITLPLVEAERFNIIQRADTALLENPTHITDSVSPESSGGKHDYYSQADYSWPNPDTTDGRPFVNRDGESWPGAFFDHRKALRSMRTNTALFTAAYLFTGDPKYSHAGESWLKEFFLDEETMMTPSLLYGQAISGVCGGRGIGIIDTLHLIDVPVAADILWKRGQLSPAVYDGLKSWFTKYLAWISTHQYGIDERNQKNNHSVCWHLQAAVFARFTGNDDVLASCSDYYKNVLLPNQMAKDGSFPLELTRTKPYGYSIFVLDNMAALCYVLSAADDNLWNFTLPDGRCIKKGLDYLYPYLDNKSSWPYKDDIACHKDWPAAMPFMLFAAAGCGDDKWLELYSRFEKYPTNDEVRRNTGIRLPYLWLWEEYS